MGFFIHWLSPDKAKLHKSIPLSIPQKVTIIHWWQILCILAHVGLLVSTHFYSFSAMLLRASTPTGAEEAGPARTQLVTLHSGAGRGLVEQRRRSSTQNGRAPRTPRGLAAAIVRCAAGELCPLLCRVSDTEQAALRQSDGSRGVEPAEVASATVLAQQGSAAHRTGGSKSQVSAIMTSVLVNPAFDDRECGRQILNLVGECRTAHGFGRVVLWTDDQVGFYEACGYHRCRPLHTVSKAVSRLDASGSVRLRPCLHGSCKAAEASTASGAGGVLE